MNLHFSKVGKNLTSSVDSYNQAVASFEVQLLPNMQQIGSRVNLINASSVYINNNLIKQIGSVATDQAVVEF